MKCNLSKNNHWVFATGFILIILGNSCIAGSDQVSEKQDNSVKPYTEGIRIGWDYSTLTRVYDGPVSYPRIIRLQNGDLLCAFESRSEERRVGKESRDWLVAGHCKI